MNEESSVALREVDRNIGGPILTNDVSSSFELCLKEFKDTYDPQSQECKKHIDDMVEILKLSEKNLEDIKNQKLFQRVWRTVSGNNKKLEKTNKLNLIALQKGSLFFLQNMAMQNQLMMKSIFFSLQRVEDIQIQNEKLKGYLFQIVNKYNDRLDNLESNVASHDQKINELYAHKKVATISIAFTIIAISGLAIFLFLRDNSFVWIAFATISLLSLIYLFFVKKHPRNVSIHNGTITTPIIDEKLAKENNELLPIIRKSISVYVYDHLIYEGYIELPIKPFASKYDEIASYCDQLTDNFTGKQYADFMDKVINTTPHVTEALKSGCMNSADETQRFFNNFIKRIIDRYLPDTIGLDLQSNLDLNDQRALLDKLLLSINSTIDKINKMEETRLSIKTRFVKYKSWIEESTGVPWKDNVKGFLKGLLIFPALKYFTDGKGYETFLEDWVPYVDSWEETYKDINENVYPAITKVFDCYTDEISSKSDVVLHSFTKHGVKLSELNDELEEMIKQQKENAESKSE